MYLCFVIVNVNSENKLVVNKLLRKVVFDISQLLVVVFKKCNDLLD